MYFSISAPQQVTLPTDPPVTLSFRVNSADSSLVEIHIVGANDEDVAGTHILTFKRNGAPSDTVFVPTPEAPKPATPTTAEVEAKKQADLKVADAPYTTSSGVYGSNSKPSVDSKPIG